MAFQAVEDFLNGESLCRALVQFLIAVDGLVDP
jgi:hypothetical protein